MVVELSLWTGVGGTLKKTNKEAANTATPSIERGGQVLWASSASTPGMAPLPCTFHETSLLQPGVWGYHRASGVM